MRQRKEGSITVFLTFIFLVIIALGCGMIELARGSVAQDQAQRLLRIGTESLQAEYSEPMYREYHLFFLEDAGKSYEDTIQFYINKNLEKNNPVSVTDMFVELWKKFLLRTRRMLQRMVARRCSIRFVNI